LGLNPYAFSAETLTSVYGLGIGLGLSNTTGDYIQSSSATALGMGMEYHGEQGLFIFRGVGTTDNSSSNLDFVFGRGNRWYRAGLAFISVEAAVPVSENHAITSHGISGVIATDPTRDVLVSVGNTALFLRLTPYNTRNTRIALDAYYGVHASGQEEIPIKVLNTFSGSLVTEPSSAGDTYGGFASWTHRVTKGGFVKIEYQWRTAHLDGAQARIKSDSLNLLDPVRVPDLDITNKALMISWVLGN
jgi:hypothetical protein